jgi:phosphate transport system substrate-binding protein
VGIQKSKTRGFMNTHQVTSDKVKKSVDSSLMSELVFNSCSVNRFNKFFWVMILAVLFSSCKNGGKIEYYPTVEEMNRGVLKVQCDESLRSIMLQQAEIFELNFPEAKIEFEFLPEQVIVENLLSGSSRTAVISRKLNEAEFKKVQAVNNIKPREHVAAKNAIAMIASSASARSNIELGELQQILSSGSTTVVVEGKQSNMVKPITEGLNLQNIKAQFFALNTADSVVSYVRKNNDVLGFISYAAISDENAHRTKELLKDILIMKIEMKKDSDLIATSANQSDIYLGDYPLVTPINYVVTDFKDKLSIGFVNFLYKPKAGRIFLHAGLVPSVMPEREVVIDTSGM